MLGPGRLRGREKGGAAGRPVSECSVLRRDGLREEHAARAVGSWGRLARPRPPGDLRLSSGGGGGRVYRRVHSAHSHGAFAGQRVERGPRLCSVACGFLETVPSRLPVHEQEGGSCLFSLCSGLRGIYRFDRFFLRASYVLLVCFPVSTCIHFLSLLFYSLRLFEFFSFSSFLK